MLDELVVFNLVWSCARILFDLIPLPVEIARAGNPLFSIGLIYPVSIPSLRFISFSLATEANLFLSFLK